jgi:hypothetical protein
MTEEELDEKIREAINRIALDNENNNSAFLKIKSLVIDFADNYNPSAENIITEKNYAVHLFKEESVKNYHLEEMVRIKDQEIDSIKRHLKFIATVFSEYTNDEYSGNPMSIKEFNDQFYEDLKDELPCTPTQK